MEDGRIILRCNLNFSGLLKGLRFGKFVFVEEDFEFVFILDVCKIENKLIFSVDC